MSFHSPSSKSSLSDRVKSELTFEWARKNPKTTIAAFILASSTYIASVLYHSDQPNDEAQPTAPVAAEKEKK